MYTDIIQHSENLRDKLIDFRRDLHKHAELGWLEIRTSSIIAEHLKKLGYEILIGKDVCDEHSRMGLPDHEIMEESYNRAIEQGVNPEFAKSARDGFTGVIGILDCGEGPTIALRFDIDALPIRELKSKDHFPFKEGFSSLNNGTMHACGHDAHTSIGLGVAEVLMANREQLRGKVKLIFQPAEEGVRGAKSIVEKGHLDDVDYVLAAHMMPKIEGSKPDIVTGTGKTMSTYKLNVEIFGKNSHAAAMPEKGNNAILAAANIILNLEGISRHSSGSTRINVGVINGGSGRNIIADYAYLEVEVRGSTVEANEYVYDYAKRIIKNSAEMHGCKYDISLAGSAITSENTHELTKIVEDVCKDKLKLKVEMDHSILSGSEDFSYMSERVISNGGQACYFYVPTDIAGPFHNEKFDIREVSMVNGVKAFCGVVYSLIGNSLEGE